MNSYEEKQEQRRQRYLDQSRQLEQSAKHRFEHTKAEREFIPLGQPVLRGHHSESRHRNHLKRMNNADRKSYEESKKAAHYRRKAKAVGRGGVSSDDPSAVAKLKRKLEKLEAKREMMKKANRIVRKKKLTDEQKVAELAKAVGWSEKTAAKLLEPDFAGRLGFPDYEITNSGANARRLKKRIAHLEAEIERPEAEDIEGEGYQVEECRDDNRVRIHFDAKPDSATRTMLKREGFRWAPSVGAWQRQLNNAGRWAAKRVAGRLTESENE